MTRSATQHARTLELVTPLGADRLLLRHLRGQEAIGQLYCYELDLCSEDEYIDPQTLLGQMVSVRVSLPSGAKRELHGMISRMALVDAGLGAEGGYFHHYRAEMRPRLWRLNLHAHCRFFHNLRVPDILGRIFDSHRIAFENTCTQNYPQHEHCTQYNETDLAFCFRLLEREGIYFFFRHDAGQDTLILADTPAAHAPLPHAQTLSFDRSLAPDMVCNWAHALTMASTDSVLNAYDFQKVTHSLNQGLLARAGTAERDHRTLQHDHDGYREMETGRHYARTRLEAAQGQAQEIEADSNALGLAAGGCFALCGHPVESQNRRYLVTGLTLNIDNHAYSSTEPAGHVETLCRLRAIPAEHPFRMPMLTPAPRAIGPQTGVVIGPADGDIHTDSHGRIQVQFNWEQFAPPAEDARMHRCWVRVAQGWAGKGWGCFFLPRAGHEVIVEFINGDIDRPLVTGSVYNTANPSPYRLPRHAAVSTLRSRSTRGQGFNEVRLIDTAGQELLFFHAEKDWKRYIKHDDLGWVGNDRHQVIEGEDRALTRKDQHLVIDGHQLQQIGKNRHLRVSGEQRIETGGNYSHDIKGSRQEQAGGKIGVQAAGNIDISSNDSMVLHGARITLSGDSTLMLQATRISLKAGASFVTLGPEGVCVSGALVKLNSGGNAGTGQAAAPAIPTAPDTPQAPRPTRSDDGSKEVE